MTRNLDGINYTDWGGYADLDAAALLAQYGGGFQNELPNAWPPNVPKPSFDGFNGWRLAKIGKRWVFVDPLGKVMLLRGMYKASYDQPHKIGGGQQAGRTLNPGMRNAKYGGSAAAWDAATASRLKHFHYNSTASASRFLSGLAFQRQSNSGIYTLTEIAKPVIGECVKNVLKHGVRPNLPGQAGWVGRNLIDSFDPKFKQFVDHSWAAIGPDPNVLFYQADDGDHMYAFGLGHPDEMEGYVHGSGSNWGPHGGMIALIGKPNITGPATDPRGVMQTWSVDTVNHTKRALIDFLIAKYGTIDALNAAWNTGGYYTTFESAGGWGVGTGIADEDGMRPRTWLGKDGAPFYQKAVGQNDFFNSTRWAPNVKIDLDTVLGMMMDAYLKPFAERLQISYPGALFIGHTGKTSRKPVVESYGRWLHLLRAGSANETLSAIMARWQGRDMPWVDALYYPNNDDGSLYYIPRGEGTQAQRGAGIAHNLTRQLTHRDADGTYRVLGNNFWGLYDQPGEKIGWGVFSYNDNPYDEHDYTVARPDPYTPGLTTLTEDRHYGDALTPIKNAHIAQFALVQAQMAGTAPDPIPEPEPIPDVPDPEQPPLPEPEGEPPMLAVTVTAEGNVLTVTIGSGFPRRWDNAISIFSNPRHEWPAVVGKQIGSSINSWAFTLPDGTYDAVFFWGSKGPTERMTGTPTRIVLPAAQPDLEPDPQPEPEPVPEPEPAPDEELPARVAALEVQMAAAVTVDQDLVRRIAELERITGHVITGTETLALRVAALEAVRAKVKEAL